MIPDIILDGFFLDVKKEIRRAEAKSPETDCLGLALMEEAGKVAKAMLSEKPLNIYKECVQTAAMALRVAVEGDPSTIPYRRRRMNADAGIGLTLDMRAELE